MNGNHVIIVLSIIIIVSYLFNLFSRWTGVPSVLLLLMTGIILRYTANITGIDFSILNELVKILGTAGLIMIVLEASLDLKLERKKIPLIVQAFFSALSILMVSACCVALLLHYFLHVSFPSAIVYAVPLSIISSAIAIPGAEHLPLAKKEFITYEASFSDILGIVIFYYLISNDVFTISSILNWGASLFIIILSSLVLSFFLLYLASKLTSQVKVFLLLAILFLGYSLGKELHLPSLTLIMAFGLILNNFNLFTHPKMSALVSLQSLPVLLAQFHSVTREISFLLRTFFFILFGFTINLTSLIDGQVLSIGLIILGILLLIRYYYFRFFLHTNLFPEVFFMPRGLITILLFYSIPKESEISYFDQGILFFLILATGLFMTLGLIYQKINTNTPGEFIH